MSYTRGEFDHRHKLTSLRMEAMKQTITLALATIAIPTAVAGLGMLPRHNTAPVAWGVFWLLSPLGLLAAILSLLCGVIFCGEHRGGLEMPSLSRDFPTRAKESRGWPAFAGHDTKGAIRARSA